MRLGSGLPVDRMAQAVTRPMSLRRRPTLDRVTFLMMTLDELSGVPATVLNLASALADRHEVEILSLYRRRRTPHFPVDERVRVRHLYDQRPLRADGERAPHGNVRAKEVPEQSAWRARLDEHKSWFFPSALRFSRLSDLLLARALPTLPPGVVVSVRPGMHMMLARLAPRHLLTVAQDHLNFPVRMEQRDMPALFGTVTRDLDALVALTGADADDYRASYPDARALVTSIPNAMPWPPSASIPPLERKVIVSVGRLEHRKGFHRVVAAFRKVMDDFPGWEVHIYGKGQEREALESLVADPALGGRVRLCGQTGDVPAALDASAIYAMGSLHEGFPMVLLEAMSRGLPVVSFDCPRGPAEIIEDGVNGRLVPDGDEAAFAQALAGLMADHDERRRLGAQGHRDVRAYGLDEITRRWESLFGEALERRSAGRRP